MNKRSKTDGGRWGEEGLGELIAELPPLPAGWAEAAARLPEARASLDGLVERALADSELRAQTLDGLEDALRAEGYEPEPQLRALLRARLDPES